MATANTIYDNINTSYTGAPSASKGAASAAEEMSQRFMTLFLAQLRNQDPLNPMDNTEMTSQLAQMNMVSGLENLNTSMKTLLGAYNEALTLQAANLIGKNVLVPGKNMVLTDEGALFGLELSGPADQVEIIIRNQDGIEVSRQSLGQINAGAQAYYWDGTDSEGNPLPPGAYSFEVAAKLNNEPVLVQTLQAGMVSALLRTDNGFMMEVAGLGNVSLAQVKQVF